MEDDVEMDTGTQKVAKYNSAISQLLRLDNVWQQSYKHMLQSNYFLWSVDLDAIWIELAGDLFNPDNKLSSGRKVKQVLNDMNFIDGELIKLSPLVSGQHSTFNKRPDDYLTKVSKQYLILRKKAVYLHQLQNDLGKGTKWEEGDDDYMD